MENGSPKSYLFIVNPVSGFNKRKKLRKLIRTIFSDRSIDFQVRKTKGPKHAGILGRIGIENHLDVIVAVGGDGTINEVGQQLIGKDSILGIVPKGSGNGLARYLGIPLSAQKALLVLKNGHTRQIDTGLLEDHLFINMGGVGFDSHIAQAFAGSRTRGVFSYLRLTLREFVHYQPSEYQIQIKGITHTRKAFLISFANSTQYGSNAHISPEAQIDDGLIDIVVMKPFSPWAAPEIAFRMLNKTIHQSRFVEIFRASEATISANHPLIGHVDGEPVQLPADFQVRANPLSIKVIVP